MFCIIITNRKIDTLTIRHYKRISLAGLDWHKLYIFFIFPPGQTTVGPSVAVKEKKTCVTRAGLIVSDIQVLHGIQYSLHG